MRISAGEMMWPHVILIVCVIALCQPTSVFVGSEGNLTVPASDISGTTVLDLAYDPKSNSIYVYSQAGVSRSVRQVSVAGVLLHEWSLPGDFWPAHGMYVLNGIVRVVMWEPKGDRFLLLSLHQDGEIYSVRPLSVTLSEYDRLLSPRFHRTTLGFVRRLKWRLVPRAPGVGGFPKAGGGFLVNIPYLDTPFVATCDGLGLAYVGNTADGIRLGKEVKGGHPVSTTIYGEVVQFLGIGDEQVIFLNVSRMVLSERALVVELAVERAPALETVFRGVLWIEHSRDSVRATRKAPGMLARTLRRFVWR